MRNLKRKHRRLLRRIRSDQNRKRAHIESLFRQQLGFAPDLKEPRRLSERLCALYIRAEDPLRPVLASRAAQMELLRAKRQDKWIMRTWGVIRRLRDVQWNELPETVVLRPDHLPGEQYLLDRTLKGWKRPAKRVIRGWMRQNAFAQTGRPEYAALEPFVQIEEHREGREMSVLCIGGEMRALYWRDDPSCAADAFGAPLCGRQIDLPACLIEISALCREVSADFPFLRLDLLIGPGQPKCTGVHLAEDAAFFRAIPKELDEELGSMLKIPNE